MSKIMQNNKALILLVAILLLTNIGVLVYFLSFKKPAKSAQQKERKSVVEYMQSEIGFNDQQAVQFKQLHENNLDSLRILREGVQKAKNAFFNLLRQPNVEDSTIRAAAKTIGDKQEAFDLNNFRHFRRVRSLCADSLQKLKFDSMVTRMVNRPFGRRGGPSRSDSGKSSEKH